MAAFKRLQRVKRVRVREIVVVGLFQVPRDSQARHLLSPCKQREGPQTEQPCSGRPGRTAAASPAAAERKNTHGSESAGLSGRKQTGRKSKCRNERIGQEKKNRCLLTWSSVALWDTVGTHSSIRRTAPDLTSFKVNHWRRGTHLLTEKTLSDHTVVTRTRHDAQ